MTRFPYQFERSGALLIPARLADKPFVCSHFRKDSDCSIITLSRSATGGDCERDSKECKKTHEHVAHVAGIEELCDDHLRVACLCVCVWEVGKRFKMQTAAAISSWLQNSSRFFCFLCFSSSCVFLFGASKR